MGHSGRRSDRKSSMRSESRLRNGFLLRFMKTGLEMLRLTRFTKVWVVWMPCSRVLEGDWLIPNQLERLIQLRPRLRKNWKRNRKMMSLLLSEEIRTCLSLTTSMMFIPSASRSYKTSNSVDRAGLSLRVVCCQIGSASSQKAKSRRHFHHRTC